MLCLGLFMILLDGTIVNIAIPSIQTYYGTSFSDIEWVMNAYILAFAVLLSDRIGSKWIVVAGIFILALGLG